MLQLCLPFEPDVDELDICILSMMTNGTVLKPAPTNIPRLERLVKEGLATRTECPRKGPHIETGRLQYRITDTGAAWTKGFGMRTA